MSGQQPDEQAGDGLEQRVTSAEEELKGLGATVDRVIGHWNDPDRLLRQAYHLLENTEPAVAARVRRAYWLLKEPAAASAPTDTKLGTVAGIAARLREVLERTVGCRRPWRTRRTAVTTAAPSRPRCPPAAASRPRTAGCRRPHCGADRERIASAMGAARARSGMSESAFAAALTARCGRGYAFGGGSVEAWESGRVVPVADVFVTALMLGGRPIIAEIGDT